MISNWNRWCGKRNLEKKSYYNILQFQIPRNGNIINRRNDIKKKNNERITKNK